MPSNVQRGAYYKGRTKRWLEASGYAVAHLEEVHWLHTPRGRLPVKRDQLGSDLLAVNSEHVVFVQVKLATDRRRLGLAGAVAELRRHPCPPCARQWVVVWRPGVRAPEVVDAGALDTRSRLSSGGA